VSQAHREKIQWFSGSQTGGKPSALRSLFRTADGRECSEFVSAKGLLQKTVQIGGDATDLAANPIVLEASITENANDKPNWFAVSGAITAPGLYTIVIAAPVYYEPELTHLRVAAVPNGTGTLPRSGSATFAAFWNGDEPWCERVQDKFSV
jgi:hypothetical protein